jgi:hypothetical protein
MSAASRGAAAPLTDLRTQAACLRFTTALLGVCLFLQRFGLPFGSQSISLVGPVGMALGAWGVWQGFLVLDRARTALFLGVIGWALVGMAWHAMVPGAYDVGPSTLSMLQFIVFTSFATISFAAPVDEAAFFDRVNRLLALFAILGIGQFFAQFIGLKLFEFTGLVPDRWLIEAGYNLVIPVGVGDVMKANGLFLMEPSVFSQFMALGLIVEMLTRRRPVFFGLFAAALLLSFSGTGMMVLASFFIVSAPLLGRRGVMVLVIGVGGLGLAGAVMALAAPDFAEALVGRLGEFSQPGTSGHLRFITPWWITADVLARTPGAWLVGIGAGVSEKMSVPYLYNVNTPVKVFLEYGLPLLAIYLGLFFRGQRGAVQGALFVPLMLQFLFTGGYQQFPPVLFVVLLFVAIARTRPSETPAGIAWQPAT